MADLGDDSDLSFSLSGRAEVNNRVPSGANLGADSPFAEKVSRLGAAVPFGSNSHSALAYSALSASGCCTAATTRAPSGLTASEVTLGSDTKPAISVKSE